MNIDTSTIEGYADMTPEEKITALERYEYTDRSDEVEKYKNALSKANSEAAEWKRKDRERMSAEEKTKAEQEEAFSAMKKELETLRNEKLSAQYKGRLVEMGFSGELADRGAANLIKGEMDDFFTALAEFLKAHDKEAGVQAMKDMKRPPAGSAGGAMTKDEIMAIRDPIARQNKIKENLSLFQ